MVCYCLIEHEYFVELLLIASDGFLEVKPCCVDQVKRFVISVLNKYTLWNCFTHVINDAADDD